MAYSPLGPTFNATEKSELIEGNLTNAIGKRHGKSGAQVRSSGSVYTIIS